MKNKQKQKAKDQEKRKVDTMQQHYQTQVPKQIKGGRVGSEICGMVSLGSDGRSVQVPWLHPLGCGMRENLI